MNSIIPSSNISAYRFFSFCWCLWSNSACITAIHTGGSLCSFFINHLTLKTQVFLHLKGICSWKKEHYLLFYSCNNLITKNLRMLLEQILVWIKASHHSVNHTRWILVTSNKFPKICTYIASDYFNYVNICILQFPFSFLSLSLSFSVSLSVLMCVRTCVCINVCVYENLCQDPVEA